jgi:undecaprenyl-phosphate galactose phosphotransferase
MFVNASSRIHEDMVRKMIKENGATTKLVGDPRITPIGKLLRKSSLDELPQLINVIKGEMSLVGPRPCLPYEYEEMKDWQKERCAILPGMTGIWQVKGRDEVLFNEQVILDLYYKEHRSLWMDLEIMAETIPVVLFGRGGG